MEDGAGLERTMDAHRPTARCNRPVKIVAARKEVLEVEDILK